MDPANPPVWKGILAWRLALYFSLPLFVAVLYAAPVCAVRFMRIRGAGAALSVYAKSEGRQLVSPTEIDWPAVRRFCRFSHCSSI